MTIDPPDGAFVIGGGDSNYGQNLTESGIRGLFTVPTPLTGDHRGSLRAALNMLPKNALKPWQTYLGGTDTTFDDKSTAIDWIIGKAIDKPEGGLQGFIDKLVQGLTGWTHTGFQTQAAKDAAEAISNSVTSLAATVQKLQQQEENGKFIGHSAVYDFTSQADASSWGSKWSQSYYGTGSGTEVISGGLGAWSGSADNRWGYARYSDMSTVTDYQKVGAVFATKPSIGLLGGSVSKNRIMCRVNASMSDFVAVDFAANSFTLSCSVSSSYTWLADGPSNFKFKVGAIYWLEAGTSGGARIFRVWENNTVLLTYADSAAVSSVGSTFRYTGLSVNAYSDNYVPAKVASYAFFDNTPPTVRGCGWRYARTSTSGATLTNGEHLFDSGYFDTTVLLTDGVSYDSSTNKATIQAAGWYLITICQGGGSAISIGSGRQAAVLYQNGTEVLHGADFFSNATSDFGGFSATYMVYCSEGDYLQPGYSTTWPSGSNSLLKGEAGGTHTYWSGTFLGNTKPS